MGYIRRASKAASGLATMLSSLGQGLALALQFRALLYQVIGVLLGIVIGVIPGLGGVQAMAILIPFIYSMSPSVAFSFLLGAHVATQYAGSITSMLMNVPASGTNIATCWDGYPLARQGRAAEALGIGAMSNVVGAWIGALVLTISVPVMQSLAVAIQPPELFMVAILGLTLVASLSGKSLMKGVISGLLGLLLASVGQDPVTGVLRYTLGVPYLMEGVNLVTVVVGMYAVGEMIRLFTAGERSIAQNVTVSSYRGVFKGMMEPFKHLWALVYASLIGTLMGIVPGIGGTVSNIVAYGQVRQASKNPETFGTGRVEGLIAPEASHIAKEGGQMIPTLALGVPGGEATAILLSAFLIVGLQPGPAMVSQHSDLIYAIVFIIALSSVFTSLIGLSTARYLSLITTVPVTVLAPVIIMFAVVGAFASTTNVLSVVLALMFGVLGYFMRRYNYSEPSLIVGLVLGTIAQPNLHIALVLYGPQFVWQRPIALGIAIATVIVLFLPTVLKQLSRSRPNASSHTGNA